MDSNSTTSTTGITEEQVTDIQQSADDLAAAKKAKDTITANKRKATYNSTRPWYVAGFKSAEAFALSLVPVVEPELVPVMESLSIDSLEAGAEELEAPRVKGKKGGRGKK